MEPACSLLVVDDDEEFLEILVRRFRRRDVRTAAAATPEAAVEAAEGQEFHVAIVDRSLPGQDGLELMLLLRDRQPKLRVILLSGHGDERHVNEGLDRGAFEYLVKPCSLADLEAAVRRAFQSAAAEDACT